MVGRDEWAEANLATLSDLLEPVAGRMEHRFDAAGPFAGALRAGTGVTMAAEVGLVTGFMAQHVLGQYELSLLALHPRPRLLMVARQPGPGRGEAWRRPRELPALGDHPRAGARAASSAACRGCASTSAGCCASTWRPSTCRSPAGRPGACLRFPIRATWWRASRRAGLAALVQTPAQREIMERVQAAMAVVEGHAEHVMDALAPELVPHHEGLRDAMERRRDDRSAPQRILMRLLGMDMKMRQYRQGKAFCDAVAARAGRRCWAASGSRPPRCPRRPSSAGPARWAARIAA